MKNQNDWQPSKYSYHKGKLKASRDRHEVSIGSRLHADLVAGFYEKYIPQYAKGRLLDLGCGKVPLFFVYKDHVENNICVDWENSLYKNRYLDYECDITKILPFENEEFDTIILSDVLEHVSQPEHLWKEMSRVLSTGGKIMMNVPFFYCLHERPYDYYRYTEFVLRRFIDYSGLRLVHLDTIGGSPEVIADILAKNIQFIPWVGESLAIFIQYITEAFIKTALGERISKKTSPVFPFGYFLIAEKI